MSYLMRGVKVPLPLQVLGAVDSPGAASGEEQGGTQSQASRSPQSWPPWCPWPCSPREAQRVLARDQCAQPQSRVPTPAPTHSLNTLSVIYYKGENHTLKHFY